MISMKTTMRRRKGGLAVTVLDVGGGTSIGVLGFQRNLKGVQSLYVIKLCTVTFFTHVLSLYYSKILYHWLRPLSLSESHSNLFQITF